TYKHGNLYMLLCGSVAMIMIWLCSDWSIRLLFGPGYHEAAAVLNILAWAVPVHFVATSVGAVLVTKDNMRRKVRCMGVVASASLMGNVAFIPSYGIEGAAVVTVFCEILLLCLYVTTA